MYISSFRTLNRDRSGKIVMNLSLVLLLLNIVFIIAVKLKPPSVECTALAAIVSTSLSKDTEDCVFIVLSLALSGFKKKLFDNSNNNMIYPPQLHYLVVSAFAWMLVEAANMYQLLITVFASAETHFMAKRVFAAWGELCLRIF